MSQTSLTRREFLQSTSVAGAAVAFAPAHLWAQPSTTIEAVPAWASKPMRWAQLTLVEDDPAHFDLAFWLDYFKRTRSDGVCLSAGGCVAYYPTEVPFHHRSTWLGNRDVLGELVTGCRKLGMSVLARTDPHATYDDAKAAHPDWIAVDAQGNPRRHWASPEMWVTCALGPYNFEFMTAVHKEIMSRYRVDGIFMNRWDGSGDCYCEHCRDNFKAATGFDLPRIDRPAGSRAPRLLPLAAAAAHRRRRRLERRHPRDQSRSPASSPTTAAARATRSTRIETSRRAPCWSPTARRAAASPPPWLMGKTAKEYRATMGDEAGRRALRRRP